MKKVILSLVVMVLAFNQSNAQDTKKYRGVLTYKDTQNSDVYKLMSKSGKAGKYISKEGATIFVGDTLVLRHAFVNIGKDSNTYSTILAGDPYDAGRAVLAGLSALGGQAPTPIYNLTEKRGEKVVIEYIRWTRQTKKRPARILLTIRSIFGAADGASKFTVTDLELAFEYKEVYHPSLPMSREDLISILKTAKDELDLGLIDPTKYEEVREEVVRKLKELK